MSKSLITSENLTMSRKLTTDKSSSLCNCSNKAKSMIPLKLHALSKRQKQRKTKKAKKN
jgi:hypothetical protein